MAQSEDLRYDGIVSSELIATPVIPPKMYHNLRVNQENNQTSSMQDENNFDWKIILQVGSDENSESEMMAKQTFEYVLPIKTLSLHSGLFHDLLEGNDFNFSDLSLHSITIQLSSLDEKTVFERIIMQCLKGSSIMRISMGKELAIAFIFFDYLQMESWKETVIGDFEILYTHYPMMNKSQILDEHMDYFLTHQYGHPTFVIDSKYIDFHYDRALYKGIDNMLMDRNIKRCLTVFSMMPADSFVEYLSQDGLSVYDEDQIVVAVDRFVRAHQKSITEKDIENLWKQVRVNLLSEEGYHAVMERSNLSNSIKEELRKRRDVIVSKRQYSKFILYTGDSMGCIERWNLKQGLCEQTLKVHNGYVHCMQVSERGKMIFLFTGGSDGKVCLSQYETSSRTFTQLKVVELFSKNPVLYLTMNEHYLLANDSFGNVVVFDISWTSPSDATPKMNLLNETGQAGSRCLAINEMSSIFSGNVDGRILEWTIGNLHTEPNILNMHTDTVMCMKTFKMGSHTYLLSAGCDRSVVLWKLDGNKTTFIKRYTVMAGYIYAIDVVVNSDTLWEKNFIVTGATDKFVVLINMASGEMMKFKGHKNFVYAVSASNTQIISASDDTTLTTWNVESGECSRVLHTGKFIRCLTTLDESPTNAQYSPPPECNIQ